MLIFIEGADGTGKSTLCQKLCDNYGIPTIRMPRFVQQRVLFEVNLDLDACYLYDTLKKENLLIALDRSFLSDWVYRVNDGNLNITFNLSTMCELLKDGLIIHCDTDNAYEDSMKRGEDNITTKEESDRIRQLYNDTFTMLHIFHDVPIIKYNWYKDNIKDLISKIKEEL